MTRSAFHDQPSLSLTALQRIEQACARFEAAWQANAAPRIEDYLGTAGDAERTQLLCELLLLDLELRRCRGETLDRETYRQRFPAEAALVDSVFTASESEDQSHAPTRMAASSLSAAARQAPDGAASLGRRIGPYQLLQRLGEGGMGTVFLAEQREPVVRHVALKLIKAGLDSGQVIGRFEQERQAVALMDHPNIARILDAGTTDAGQPYFVMELVTGIPITRYCDQERLPPRERLELFIPVCQAVQHAHQKGIIHRDLKPSNVLVTRYDGKPVPKVIDFGLAKAVRQKRTGQTRLTEAGIILGTLEYMAPEQADPNNLDVDTRADVYALGVILYELLTGVTPLDHERIRPLPLLKILELIREEEPPAPSVRLSQMRNAVCGKRNVLGIPHSAFRIPHLQDLDWITMKALEKDRGRRYETANDLALDLQRHLHDEPVLAGPPGAGYRLRKFLRRNKGPAVAAALVFLALVGGIVGTTIGLVRALRAESSAVANATEANRQRQRAEDSLRQANQVVDDFFTRVSEHRLLNVPGLLPLRQELLESALRFYQGFLRERADDPTIEVELATTYYRVARITKVIGDLKAAHETARAARVRLETLVGKQSGDRDLQRLLAQCHGLVGSLEVRSDPAAASRSYEAATDILTPIVGAHPGDRLARQELAENYYRVGLLREMTARNPDQLSQALAAYERCRDLREALAREDPARAEFQNALAEIYYSIGILQRQLEQPEKALRLYEQALAIQEPLVQKHAEEVRFGNTLASIYNAMGYLHHRAKEPSLAIAAYDKARRLYEALTADHPRVIPFQDGLARAYLNLGTEHQRKGEVQEALTALEQACAIRRQLADKNPDDAPLRSGLGNALNGLGLALLDSPRREEAPEVFHQAINHQCVAFQKVPQHTGFRRSLTNHYISLAISQRKLRRFPEAVAALQEARGLCRSAADQVYLIGREQLLLATGVGKNSALLTEAEQQHQRAFADQARQNLSEAMKSGYDVFERLERDPQCEGARDHALFVQLVRRLKDESPGASR
jgi:serine/threonine protein kinase